MASAFDNTLGGTFRKRAIVAERLLISYFSLQTPQQTLSAKPSYGLHRVSVNTASTAEIIRGTRAFDRLPDRADIPMLEALMQQRTDIA